MSNKNQDKMDGIFADSQAEKSATAADKPARPPKPKTPMGRETKVGLAVIAALLVIFVIVLVVRLRGDGEGDGDVAQKGGSESKDDSRDKSKVDQPKTAVSQNATVIRPYGSNPWEATSEMAKPGYGALSSDQNRAAAQNGSEMGDPRNGDAPSALGYPAGQLPTQTDVDGSTKNPFDARSAPPPALSTTNRNTGSFLPSGNNPSLDSHKGLNDGRTTNGSAVGRPSTEEPTGQDFEPSLPPYRKSDNYATQQANDARADVTEGPGEIAPPFENNGMQGGTTALKGRRLDEFENPQQVDATSSGVRIVGDNAIDEKAGYKSTLSSTELEKVQDIQPDAGMTQPAVASTDDPNDIDSFNDPRFLKKQPQVVESAPSDDAAAAADDVAPARLSNAAATPADELYTVQRNDNYWSIAQKQYGSGAYFKALYEYNRRQAGQRTPAA
jgi:hypothetical protein